MKTFILKHKIFFTSGEWKNYNTTVRNCNDEGDAERKLWLACKKKPGYVRLNIESISEVETNDFFTNFMNMLKKKETMKVCKAEDCSYPVFSNLYCRNHQYLRTGKSVPILRKSPIKAVYKPTGEGILFQSIIATHPHRSVLSNKPIHDIGPKNMAHLWPKGTYPELRLLDINICILTFEEHRMYDQGTIAEREAYAKENNCDWGVIERLKQAVLS